MTIIRYGGDDGDFLFNISNAPPPNEFSVVNDYIFSIINVRKRDIEIQNFPFSNAMFLMLFIFPLKHSLLIIVVVDCTMTFLFNQGDEMFDAESEPVDVRNTKYCQFYFLQHNNITRYCHYYFLSQNIISNIHIIDISHQSSMILLGGCWGENQLPLC